MNHPGQGHWPGGGGQGWPSAPQGGGWSQSPPPRAESASGRAIACIVMAIWSWLTCWCVLSIPVAFIARAELSAIERGEAPKAGKQLAEAAFWIALVNAILTTLVACLYVLLVLVFGLWAAAIPTRGP